MSGLAVGCREEADSSGWGEPGGESCGQPVAASEVIHQSQMNLKPKQVVSMQNSEPVQGLSKLRDLLSKSKQALPSTGKH